MDGSDGQKLGGSQSLSRRDSHWVCAGIAAVFLLTILQLRFQGRIWWCQCGEWFPFARVYTTHTSQHLADAYSITHVTHGFLFYGFLALVAPRLSMGKRLLVSMIIEAGWELLENTDFIIQRYREATISLDYFGDSVLNSVGDLFSCWLGFALARRFGLWPSVAWIVVTEIVLLFWIRDNLTLNVVMLLWPLDGIKAWQAGG